MCCFFGISSWPFSGVLGQNSAHKRSITYVGGIESMRWESFVCFSTSHIIVGWIPVFVSRDSIGFVSNSRTILRTAWFSLLDDSALSYLPFPSYLCPEVADGDYDLWNSCCSAG